MTEMPESASVRFRLVHSDGSAEELDRLAVRDRIRSGDIDVHTRLSIAGTDEVRRAGAFPELVRYFEMLHEVPRVTASQQQGVPVPKPRAVEPMSARIRAGVLYPVEHGQLLTLVLLAVFSALPIVWILSTLATVATMLAIVRKSAEGSTKMPTIVEAGDVPNLVRLYVGVVFITLVSMLPAIIVFVWGVTALATQKASLAVVLVLELAAMAFAAFYYPACLATAAVWDNVLSALNPDYVRRVIATMGSDYVIVVAMWFVANVIGMIIRLPLFATVSALPLLGSMFGSFISLWVLFYASHLLGYAVYRHAPELGWE